MDYHLPRATRTCSKTGRALAPGEAFHSVLIFDEGQWKRLDIAAEAWEGPPEGAVAEWKARVPGKDEHHQPKRAPNEVLWQFFQEVHAQGGRPEVAYVLALLLLRRRVFRPEENPPDDAPDDALVVYSPRDDHTYVIPNVDLDPEQAAVIQQELDQLLEVGTGAS